MNSNGRGRSGGAGVYARRAVSLGGLFTTLAANNERKNWPDRYLDALPFKENVIGEMSLSPLLPATSDDVARVSEIIETIPRTLLITDVAKNPASLIVEFMRCLNFERDRGMR